MQNCTRNLFFLIFFHSNCLFIKVQIVVVTISMKHAFSPTKALEPRAILSYSSLQFDLESLEIDSSRINQKRGISQSKVQATASSRERESMASILKWIVDPHRNPLAAMHNKTVANRLRRYGNYLIKIVCFLRCVDS